MSLLSVSFHRNLGLPLIPATAPTFSRPSQSAPPVLPPKSPHFSDVPTGSYPSHRPHLCCCYSHFSLTDIGMFRSHKATCDEPLSGTLYRSIKTIQLILLRTVHAFLNGPVVLPRVPREGEAESDEAGDAEFGVHAAHSLPHVQRRHAPRLLATSTAETHPVTRFIVKHNMRRLLYTTVRLCYISPF